MSVLDDATLAQHKADSDLSKGSAGAPTTIIICSSCRDEADSDARPRPGLLLGDRVREIAGNDDFEIVQVECLANCKRRLSAAVTKPGGWTYVFGHLTLEDAGDLIEGARLYRDADNGLIPWRGRPECLKRGLIARVPPTSCNGKSE